MNTLVMSLLLCFCAAHGYLNRGSPGRIQQQFNPYLSSNTYSVSAHTSANNNGNTRSSNNFLNYLPFLGRDEGRQLAGYSMMLNSNGNNMMLPYLMNGGESSSVLPMMAFMNSGGRRVNPFVMSMLMEQEL